MLESDNQIHVLGLSETLLNSIHPDSAFEVNGFRKPFRKDRETNSWGGALCYLAHECKMALRSLVATPFATPHAAL